MSQLEKTPFGTPTQEDDPAKWIYQNQSPQEATYPNSPNHGLGNDGSDPPQSPNPQMHNPGWISPDGAQMIVLAIQGLKGSIDSLVKEIKAKSLI